MRGNVAMAKGENKNEVIAQEWTALKMLWEGCRADVTDVAVRSEIDALFSPGPKWSSGPEDWFALNYAEQCVAKYLNSRQLVVEYPTLLDLARSRKIAALARYEKDADLFATSTTDGEQLATQRTVYQSLLHILQSDFVEARFRRRLRRETAVRLFYFGVGVMTLAVLPVFIYWRHSRRRNPGCCSPPEPKPRVTWCFPASPCSA
jgi:hypothetical protein